MFYADNGNIGEVNYCICQPGSTSLPYPVRDREIICVRDGTIPTSIEGFLINLNTACNY
jgi:hypothetical protein